MKGHGSIKLHWCPILIWFLKCNLLRLLESKSFPLLTAAGFNTGANEGLGAGCSGAGCSDLSLCPVFLFPSFVRKQSVPALIVVVMLQHQRINLRHLLYNSEKFASNHMTHTRTMLSAVILRDCSCKTGPDAESCLHSNGLLGTIRAHRRRLSLGRPWQSVTEAKFSCLWLGCYRRAQECCLELGKTGAECKEPQAAEQPIQEYPTKKI